MLHTVQRDHVRVYCGPWALAALTGQELWLVREAVHRALEERAGGSSRDRVPKQIRGLYTSEVVRSLELLGHRAEQVVKFEAWEEDPVQRELYGYGYRRAHRPTLRAWCTQLDRHHVPGKFLIHCGWHYVSAAYSASVFLKLSDNLQRTPSPVPWHQFRGAHRRMWGAWAVTKI